MTLKKYEEIARQIIWKNYKKKRLLHDFELVGSVMEALIEADRTHQPSRGTPLEIYRKIRANWTLWDYFRKKNMISIDQEYAELKLKNILESADITPEDELIREEQELSLEERVRRTLAKFGASSMEKEYIVQYYVNGLSIKEIAKTKCVSHQTISAAINNGLKKLAGSSREEISRLLGV